MVTIKNSSVKTISDSMFSITFLWISISVGVTGPVIFMPKGGLVNTSPSDYSLLDWYILSEIYCVITNKVAFMDEENW